MFSVCSLIVIIFSLHLLIITRLHKDINLWFFQTLALFQNATFATKIEARTLCFLKKFSPFENLYFWQKVWLYRLFFRENWPCLKILIVGQKVRLSIYIYGKTLQSNTTSAKRALTLNEMKAKVHRT